MAHVSSNMTTAGSSSIVFFSWRDNGRHRTPTLTFIISLLVRCDLGRCDLGGSPEAGALASTVGATASRLERFGVGGGVTLAGSTTRAEMAARSVRARRAGGDGGGGELGRALVASLEDAAASPFVSPPPMSGGGRGATSGAAAALAAARLAWRTISVSLELRMRTPIIAVSRSMRSIVTSCPLSSGRPATSCRAI